MCYSCFIVITDINKKIIPTMKNILIFLAMMIAIAVQGQVTELVPQDKGARLKIKKSATILPSSVDHSGEMQEVPFNQTPSGVTCVGCAWAHYLSWLYAKINFLPRPEILFSPSFIYNTYHQPSWPAGMGIFSGAEFICQHGCATTDIFPFVPNNTDTLPGQDARYASLKYLGEDWEYTNDLATAKAWLLEGALVSNYGPNHAVCYVGYDDNKIIGADTGAFHFINSYGSGWGENGYGWQSYNASLNVFQYYYRLKGLNNTLPAVAVWNDIENCTYNRWIEKTVFYAFLDEFGDTIKADFIPGKMPKCRQFFVTGDESCLNATSLVVNFYGRTLRQRDSTTIDTVRARTLNVNYGLAPVAWRQESQENMLVTEFYKTVIDTIWINQTAFYTVSHRDTIHEYAIEQNLYNYIELLTVGSGDDLKAEDDLRIWPNPARETINMATSRAEMATIFDLSGKIIKKFAVNAGENRINVGDLKPGIYFIKTAKNGKKIVIL